MNGSTITLPKKIFKNYVQASEDFERAQSDLEDYILAHSQEFLTKIRRARKEHGAGKFSDWKDLKLKYGV